MERLTKEIFQESHITNAEALCAVHIAIIAHRVQEIAKQ